MPTTPRLQPRLAHMGLPLRLLLGLATLILLGHSLREFMTRASDVSFCAMTYMWPAFELISEVPSTGVQALDAKYRLYLYREMDGRHADEVCLSALETHTEKMRLLNMLLCIREEPLQTTATAVCSWKRWKLQTGPIAWSRAPQNGPGQPSGCVL
jgi:hypothetical protein